jgi:hypothetical protein
LSFLWIIAASFGRLATVRSLLEYFREKTDGDVSSRLPKQSVSFRLLLPLQLLRIAALLAVLLALGGAVLLAGLVSSEANPRPGLVIIVFLPLAWLIGMAWSVLNWLLSLASIFVVRDGRDALGALAAAVTFFRERMGAVLAVSTWTGLAHIVAFSMAASAIAVPLALVQVAPARLMLAIAFLLTLAYFAVVDWLYIARLAGYICIAEMPEALTVPASSPVPPTASQRFETGVPAQTSVDRDEPILSDLPSFTPAT